MKRIDAAARPLEVTVEATPGTRSVGVAWSPEVARTRVEYARLFLVPLGTDLPRTYLELVDHRPDASVRLPETLAAGRYAIEVDAYGSSSWGDGRLEGRGRSAPFLLGPAD
ncbi:hypothetical protein ACWEVD_09010 [Nocardia thailandica]